MQMKVYIPLFSFIAQNRSGGAKTVTFSSMMIAAAILVSLVVMKHQ